MRFTPNDILEKALFFTTHSDGTKVFFDGEATYGSRQIS